MPFVRRLQATTSALALLGAVVTAEPGWAQSSADQQNEHQIAANHTATAAARATFETQNAGAIARHGAPEPTQTPGPTWTPTPTSTPVPLPAPTDPLACRRLSCSAT